MLKVMKLILCGIAVFIGVLFGTVPQVVKAYSYNINITNLNDNSVQTLNYDENGKIQCKSGILEYSYVDAIGVNEYRKLVFDERGYHTFDQAGNDLGYCESPYFDLQSLLIRPVRGGSLTVNFYNGDFVFLGPYRIFANTTLNAPDKNARIVKMTDTYLFINTDDAEAASLNLDSNMYGGSGNIKISGLTFDCGGLGGQVAKLIHAANFSFEGCVFQNARCNSHVLEMSCLKDVVITGCIFYNTSESYDNPAVNATNNYETIQIESAHSTESFPYCRFQKYDDGYVCNTVSITDSRFQSVLRAIGNHSGDAAQNNIKIERVIFDNIFEDAIHFFDHAKTSRLNNVFSNVLRACVNEKESKH